MVADHPEVVISEWTFGVTRNIGLRSRGGRNNRKLTPDRWEPSFELRGLPARLSPLSLSECFVQ